MKLPRWYPILDSALLTARGCDPQTAAQGLIDGGARILQWRHKGQWTRDAFETATHLSAMCRDRGVLFVINDRADIAVLTAAAIHAGQDDLQPSVIRRIVGEETPIGFSTHNEAQLRAAAAEPVDYLALGPIFGTVSKQNPDPVVGTAELARLRPLSALPLVAIGGITRERAQEVLAAGADSVAAIGDLCPGEPTLAAWKKRAEQWMNATNG